MRELPRKPLSLAASLQLRKTLPSASLCSQRLHALDAIEIAVKEFDGRPLDPDERRYVEGCLTHASELGLRSDGIENEPGAEGLLWGCIPIPLRHERPLTLALTPAFQRMLRKLRQWTVEQQEVAADGVSPGEAYPVYPGDHLPPKLRAALNSALSLVHSSAAIVGILTSLKPRRDESESVAQAISRVLELRGRLKECTSSILAVTAEITTANRKTHRLASRYSDFTNAHQATLDVAGLVCELIWDSSYRERGFDSPQELFSLPLTSEVVTAALPTIAQSLRVSFAEQNWGKLCQQLLVEADTTAAYWQAQCEQTTQNTPLVEVARDSAQREAQKDSQSSNCDPEPEGAFVNLTDAPPSEDNRPAVISPSELVAASATPQPIKLDYLSIFQAAVKFARAIWEHLPLDVFDGVDPFDVVEWGVWGSVAYELSVALKRPDYKVSEWQDAVVKAGPSPAVSTAMVGLYRTYDLQKAEGQSGCCRRGALRQAFGLLHRGLWELHPQLTPIEKTEVAQLIQEIDRLWGWGPTFREPAIHHAVSGNQNGAAAAGGAPGSFTIPLLPLLLELLRRRGMQEDSDGSHTVWEEALSQLFPAIKIPITDERDTEEKLKREYRFPEDATSDECALRDYLARYRLGGVRETSRISAELARLDGESFGIRLAQHLRQKYPQELEQIIAIVLRKPTDAGGEQVPGEPNATGKRQCEGGAKGRRVIPLRSWTQSDLDAAIQEYKARRASNYRELVDRVAKGNPGAVRAAQRLFGRNAIARALGVKAKAMVSKSEPWREIARELQLPTKADGQRGLSTSHRIGEAMALERKAEHDGDTTETEVLRREAIRHAQAKLPKQQADAVIEVLERGEVSVDKVHEIINLAVESKKESKHRRSDRSP